MNDIRFIWVASSSSSVAVTKYSVIDGKFIQSFDNEKEANEGMYTVKLTNISLHIHGREHSHVKYTFF